MDWRFTAAIHAAERSADLVHRRMARGLDGLATVAATAPFLGLFATVFGIIGSFRGCDGSRASCMGALAEWLSQSMIPAALGLALAILASAGHKHLRDRLAGFDIDMQRAARSLPDYLAACLQVSIRTL
jgi:biopolymer transport protein ExbB/TolQ